MVLAGMSNFKIIREGCATVLYSTVLAAFGVGWTDFAHVWNVPVWTVRLVITRYQSSKIKCLKKIEFLQHFNS
ncbi:hypothetical protein ACH3XW_36190 [Acanthocheilonema viteae]